MIIFYILLLVFDIYFTQNYYKIQFYKPSIASLWQCTMNSRTKEQVKGSATTSGNSDEILQLLSNKLGR
jgi:hypothetical protein